jgi:SAM-dependent methyltransferase
MRSSKDKVDEMLKDASKNWWSCHSQDYVDPGEVDHLGVPEDISDRELITLLDKFDRNFARDGYFAQRRGESLFSGLLPKDLAGKKVLEVGCGLGAHTEEMCKLGAIVTSIDIAPMSVAITKRRLGLKNLKAKVIEGDAENLPFPNSHFDYVWSWGVIHHSPNTVQCAKEIARVLKPEGALGIMLYNRNSLYNWFNVVFRYGILQAKLMEMSLQDLKNRYTDGKALSGAPLSKYYSAREIRENLFPDFFIDKQIAFEQKHAVSFMVPVKYRRRFELLIPDGFYTKIWSKFGFLLFTEARKK